MVLERSVRDQRVFPRVNTCIFAHIVNDNRLHVIKLLDLSCWGAKIKVDNSSFLHHHIHLKFVYKHDYSLGAEIVEKMSETEYRIKFIFHDFKQVELLKRDIQREYSSSSSGMPCKR